MLTLLLTSCLRVRVNDQPPPSGQKSSNTISVLYADDTHIYVSTLDLSPELEICIFNCYLTLLFGCLIGKSNK